MLALPICCIAINIILYLVLIIPFVYFFNKEYEVKTNIIRVLFVVGHLIFFLFGMLMPATSFVFYYVKNDIPSMITFSALSLLFSPIGLFVIFINTLFEAIKEDKVYLYRFFRLYEIKICDIIEIKREDSFLREMIFVCRNNFRFEMNPTATGFNNFMKLLYKKMSNN